MTISSRIDRFIKHLGITRTAFAKSCGINPSSMSQMLNKRTTPYPSTINRILARYPQLNREWLMSGNGDMICEVMVPVTVKDRMIYFASMQGDSERELNRIIGASNGYITKVSDVPAQKINLFAEHYQNVSLQWLILGSGDAVSKQTLPPSK